MEWNNSRVDKFRLAAAIMVVAIHIGPLGIINERLDFGITYCLARVGVPFFFIVTGYFVLGRRERQGDYMARILRLYALATILYLPVNFYAGKQVEGVAGAMRDLLFDGTFYHLWYFPAVLIGSGIVAGLLALCGERQCGIIALLLYIAGTLGDSYGNLVMATDIGENFYRQLFAISDYTRNGIFYAPIFLWMGVMLRRKWAGETAEPEQNNSQKKRQVKWTAGLAASVILMLAEGFFTYQKGWQRHNSMYFMLLPVMYFLSCILFPGNREVRMESVELWEKAKWRGKRMRDISLWIYLLHPLCIILVRGGAKVTGLTWLLVENTIVHFLAVCVVSVAGAYTVSAIWDLVKKGKKHE